MTSVPIVFSFDDNLKIPACVCISSLLQSKKKDTFYEIYILYIELEKETINSLKRLEGHFNNFTLQFVSVKNHLDEGFVIRGISKAAYSRLLIPRLFKKHARIFYSDVDVIFTDDLSSLLELPIDNFKVAGVIAPTLSKNHIKRIGIKGEYINSGFLLFNTEAIEDEDVEESVKLVHSSKFKYQDQDILNIVYDGFIYTKISARFIICPKKIVPLSMGNTETLLNVFGKKGLSEIYSLKGIIHYVGPKPWESSGVALGDIWWEAFRNSIYYDLDFYINSQKVYVKLPTKLLVYNYIKKKIEKNFLRKRL